jgi:hypothetical protein
MEGPTPPGCDGSGGPYYYSPIYFRWDLHKNLTAVAHHGPVATFAATWYSPAGCQSAPANCDYIEPNSFEINVPVVHPIGETTAFIGWLGTTVSRWQQTLQCCDSGNNGDGQFDFVGDCVRESIYQVPIPLTIPTVFGLRTINNGCFGQTPGRGNESHFPIEQGSHYEDDLGILNLPQGTRPAACIDFTFQSMYFKSQAERFFSSSPYSHNQMKLGTIPDPNNSFDGLIFASRSTSAVPNFSTPSIRGHGSGGGFQQNEFPFTKGFTQSPGGQFTTPICGD